MPALARIKKDFGWQLPADERNENDYQIAYQADWYEYALAQPLNDTIFLNRRYDEPQKMRTLDNWEKEILNFIQTHAQASARANTSWQYKTWSGGNKIA
ncbi:MAG: hypothetical protein LBK68_00050 [Candidatus Margulisbacteria bacterium]|nr:hypothetical protein [Candidatus Margulisiibacteriota bacterium]